MISVQNNSNSDSNRSFVKAQVVYEDINHNNPIHRETISGLADSRIDLNNCLRKIPSGYQFAGYGEFNRQLKNNSTNVIYVRNKDNAIKQNKSNEKHHIILDYLDKNDRLVDHHSFAGYPGDSFKLSHYVNNVPAGYQFKRIILGNNVKAFNNNTQVIVIALNKVTEHSIITVEYVYNHKPISRNVTKGIVGHAFDLRPYKEQTPAHYRFVKVNDQVPKVFKRQNTTIHIVVAPVSESKPKTKASKTTSNVRSTNHHAKNFDDSNDDQNIGKILSRIGSSLNLLGKTLQGHNHHKN